MNLHCDPNLSLTFSPLGGSAGLSSERNSALQFLWLQNRAAGNAAFFIWSPRLLICLTCGTMAQLMADKGHLVTLDSELPECVRTPAHTRTHTLVYKAEFTGLALPLTFHSPDNL